MIHPNDSRLPNHFWEKMTVTDRGCWEWHAKKNRDGYACWVWKAGPHRTSLAHRVAYLALIGPIPNGRVLDHLCRVRHCVNPSHLEPVTQSENLRRGVGPEMSRTTQCVNGHVREGANVYVAPSGRRLCRPCNTAAQRRRHERLRIAS